MKRLLNEEEKQLSGQDMAEILKYCGYKLIEFSNYLRKSDPFVSQILRSKAILPLRYYDDLRQFVGPDNFSKAIEYLKDKYSHILERQKEKERG